MDRPNLTIEPGALGRLGEHAVGEEDLPGRRLVLVPCLHVVFYSRAQFLHEGPVRRPQLLDDLRPLVDVVGPGEEHPPPDQFPEDASNRPDIHWNLPVPRLGLSLPFSLYPMPRITSGDR